MVTGSRTALHLPTQELEDHFGGPGGRMESSLDGNEVELLRVRGGLRKVPIGSESSAREPCQQVVAQTAPGPARTTRLARTEVNHFRRLRAQGTRSTPRK